MACWQHAKLTPPQEYITLQLHIKKLSLKSMWARAEQLFYNEDYKE